jgi:hypothetical protein
MTHTDPELRELFSEAGRYGANLRDLGTTIEQRRDHTAPARAAKAAKYLERLKAEIDPDGLLPDDERERQARKLLEARAAKKRLDDLRSQHKRRLVERRDAETLELAEAYAS